MRTQVAENLVFELMSGRSTDGALTSKEWLQSLLRAIRSHLGMDVGFISEFKDGQRIFIQVDSLDPNCPVAVGGSDPLEDTYCQKVVDGRMPELMPDTAMIPEAMSMPVTAALPVGAHLGVPIKLRDGQVYGTFCCFSAMADRSLNERDLSMMHVFAEIASEQIQKDLDAIQLQIAMEERVKAVLSNGCLTMVYQPIFGVQDGSLAGFESLARFSAEPRRGPDAWFAEAAQVGLARDLECRAIELALRSFTDLPTGIFVSVNLSPDTLIESNLRNLFDGYPIERIILEVTEHSIIESYLEVTTALKALREKGLRLAIDDFGAGFANFQHILNLKPDIIKLDIDMTRNIESDPSRRALAIALARFSDDTGSVVVAEGVETAAELEELRDIGIQYVQGYFLGKPMAIGTVAGHS